jgi:hypothetical protein
VNYKEGETMKKMIGKRIFAQVALTASLLGLGTITSYGQEDSASYKTNEISTKSAQLANCTVHNVAGAYGYSASGFAVVENPFGPPPTPVNEVGTFVLNADGTFTITKAFQNINGFVFQRSNVTGTYTVFPDCTTEASNQFGDTFFGVFVDDRREIRYARIGGTEPGRIPGVVVYVAKRM